MNSWRAEVCSSPREGRGRKAQGRGAAARFWASPGQRGWSSASKGAGGGAEVVRTPEPGQQGLLVTVRTQCVHDVRGVGRGHHHSPHLLPSGGR